MKVKHNISAILLGSLLMVGCGAQDAIDATKDMPGKMDATLGQITKTNQEMEKTTDAIHKQTLLLGLEEMLKPENTKYLVPPTGMLAGGEAFAQEATAEEIVKLAYVWLKEVQKGIPDDLSQLDEKGLVALIHEKMVKLTALQVITGLAPQKTIEALVQDQILNGGRYEDTAYAVLMTRALFIKSFLLDESLMSPAEKLNNLGKVEEAFDRTSQLDYLVRLPFAKKIGLKVKVTEIELEVDESLEGLGESLGLSFPLTYWQRIQHALEKEIEEQHLMSPLARQRKDQLKQKLSPYLKAWHLL
ncbi:MAG: hypothetical protein KDD43_07335 [Bdellovibrionales bacterium]|nr:hypothetical protein [Bdellovibrionales bacterium]